MRKFLRSCVCGRQFHPDDEEKEAYCSSQCAQVDTLNVLQGNRPRHGTLPIIRTGAATQSEPPRTQPHSRFSKPLPRILTIWLNENDDEPPSPLPKSARHLLQNPLLAALEPASSSSNVPPPVLALPPVIKPEREAPLPPLPKSAQLKKARTGHKKQRVVPSVPPPVPRVPSWATRPSATTRNAPEVEQPVMRTYIPPTRSSNVQIYKPRVSQSSQHTTVSQSSHQRPAAVADLERRMYAASISKGPPSQPLPVDVRRSSSMSQIPQNMFSDMFEDDPPDTNEHPPRRPRHSRSHTLGEDIPILIPDSYRYTQCIEQDSATATPSQTPASQPRPVAVQTDSTRPLFQQRQPKHGQSMSLDRGTSVLEEAVRPISRSRFTVDGNTSSDVWRTVQALRDRDPSQEELDYRQRLFDRPTVYFDE